MAQTCTWDGFLADDVSFKYNDEGKPNAFIRLKCPAEFKGKDGKEYIDYLAFSAYDDAATAASEGKKDDPIVIRGRVRNAKDKDGNYKLSLIASKVWLGRPSDNG